MEEKDLWEVWRMARTILCPHCNSSLNEDILKEKNSENICLVCGGKLDNGCVSTDLEAQKEKSKYYYYDSGSATLTKTLYSDSTPLYTFEAVDMKDAERQLKEVMPNSPLFSINPTSQTRCPYCYGTQIQIVPKKFSLLTGFATNKFDRMCVRCQKRF